MKILKVGNPKGPEYEETCKNCGCVFLYNSKDINIGIGFLPRYVECPTCGNWIEVVESF